MLMSKCNILPGPLTPCGACRACAWQHLPPRVRPLQCLLPPVPTCLIPADPNEDTGKSADMVMLRLGFSPCARLGHALACAGSA
jgi:hypothetical protein